MIPVRWLKRSACDLCLWCRESEIYLRSVYTERLSIFHCFIYPKVYRFASWNPVKVKRYIHLLVHERNVACSPESLSRVLQYNLTHLMLNPISSRNSAVLLRIPSPLNISLKILFSSVADCCRNIAIRDCISFVSSSEMCLAEEF